MLEVWGVPVLGAPGQVAAPLPIFRALLSARAFRDGSLWTPPFAEKQRLLLLFIPLERGGGGGCSVSRPAKLLAASPCPWDRPCALL